MGMLYDDAGNRITPAHANKRGLNAVMAGSTTRVVSRANNYSAEERFLGWPGTSWAPVHPGRIDPI